MVKKPINVRLPVGMLAELKKSADASGQSLSDVIRSRLEDRGLCGWCGGTGWEPK